MRTFFWRETADLLADLATQHRFVFDPDRRVFRGGGIEVRPPLVQPIPPGVESFEVYRLSLPAEPGPQLVVLLQAGAAALGWFAGGQALHTKSFKKYVVRGRGRAQPTHLRAKGRSRYGSRLRLQNARALLVETNGRTRDWVAELGPPSEVFYNAPVRLWSELFRAPPPPPFDRTAAIRIPKDLPVPTTDVLRRTYKAMCHGSLFPVGHFSPGEK